MNGKIALQLLCLLAVGSGGACIKTRPPPPPRTTSTSLSSVPPSTFIVPGEFPTSVFSRYYNNPTQTVSQVQPVISDPVNNIVYPLELTDPDTIPKNDTTDPIILPPQASPNTLLAQAATQINNIAHPETANSPFVNNACAQCQAALGVAKMLVLAAPQQGPAIAEALCNSFDLSSDCATVDGPFGTGPTITQVLSFADVAGLDGQMICQNFFNGACPMPPTAALDMTGWFAKSKPNPLPLPKKPSGERLKVLHLSDFHLDPRYTTGAEANCTSGLCCRKGNAAKNSPNETLFPAPRYGSYLCDSPYALALAALQAIPVLTGTESNGFNFTLFTGDLVSHDSTNQLSRDYIMYTEAVVYDLFKRLLNAGPVYATLGNHDSYLQAQDSPHSLGGAMTDQFSWNYDHVSSLWEHEQWLPESAIATARAEYAAYMVQRQDGLRIITLNTDFWYKANWFNYINLTTADSSGMLRFLTDELQDAEDAGDRVWILGHVLPGWDGTNAMEDPTNIFYQIVDRFSPHVIANMFFGHTHEDQFSIFYSNNGSTQDASTALTTAWMTVSITPLTNLNSGFRVYEIDSATFEILDAHTWRADVNAFPALDDQHVRSSEDLVGPTYEHEYSTREAYGANIAGWGPNDPLNATWWHKVTEVMASAADNGSLVAQFTNFQGKESVRSPACDTTDCVKAKVCYMRSGSSSLALQNCIPGFGSVQ